MLPAFAQHHLVSNQQALLALGAPSVDAITTTSSGIECLGTDDTPASWSAWLLNEQGQRIAVHSRRDPMREAAAWLDHELAGRALPSVVCVVGAGLGFVLDAIVERSSATRIVAFEPEPSLARGLLARRDWTALLASKRLRVLVGPDYPGVEHAWRAITDPDTEPLVLVHPVIGRERPAAVATALRHVRRIISDGKANETARRLFAVPYLLNTLENLPLLAREGDVRSLSGQFAGLPVIVAAAGPSLDRNLDALKTVRDRAILVAVDTALRPLLHAGIEPDFAVAVDPGVANVVHLTGLPPCPGTSLIAELSLAPAIFEQFRDRTFGFRVGTNHPWPWLDSQGVGLGVLDAWGSVLVTTVDFAVRIGGNPVVLVGADLAYTDGQPYCRGTAYEDSWAQYLPTHETLRATWDMFLADASGSEPGLDGRPYLVAPRLLAFRDGLRDRLAKQRGTRFINASGTGILTGDAIEQGALLDVFRARRPHGIDVAARVREARARGAADAATITLALLKLFHEVPPDWESGPGVAPIEAFLSGLVTRLHARPRRRVQPSWHDQGVEWSEWIDPGERVRRHAARWTAVARGGPVPLPRWPFERIQALRAAASMADGKREPAAPASRPSDPDGDVVVRAVTTLAKLLRDDRAAHAIITPDLLRRVIPAGQAPASSLFEWPHAGQADIDAFQIALTVLAGQAVDTEPHAPGAYRATAITRVEHEAHQADRQPGLPVWTGVDALARTALFCDWMGVVASLRSAAADGESRRDVRRNLAGWMSAHRAQPSIAGDVPGLQCSFTHAKGGVPNTTRFALGLAPQRAARLLTGRWCRDAEPRTADGLVLAESSQLDNAARWTLSLACDDPRDPDPRARFLHSAGGWIEPLMLRERGISGGGVARTWDNTSAIFTSNGLSNHGIRIAADGSCHESPAWPVHWIFGEAPWRDGGTLAWGHDGEQYVVALRTADGSIAIDRVPFWPWEVLTPPGSAPLWPTHDRGLWEWVPGQGGRQVADVPSCRGGRIVPEGIRLEPSFRLQAEGSYVARREGEALLYDPATQAITSWPLPAEGPCWSTSVRGAWTAEAYVHADAIRLAHRDGHVVWLACFAPRTVAWAGASLVVTSFDDVMLFGDLLSMLDGLHSASRAM